MKYLVLCILLPLLVSCAGDSELVRAIEEIRSLSNSDPVHALTAYDSLRRSGPTPKSEYGRMKYDLLGIRVRDKNDIIPQSDSLIRVLVEYFEGNGSNQELQEAYYYAGSVYRDLKDTPRSLNFFQRSSLCSESGPIDSLTQRNCFSQLYYIYHNVQDYIHALDAAEKECRIAEEIGVLDDCSLIHVSNAQIRLDNDSAALDIMSGVLRHQQSLSSTQRNVDVIYDLLNSYSQLHDIEKASLSYHLLVEMDAINDDNYVRLLTLAKYYRAIGDTSSSISYYQRIADTKKAEEKYDAYKRLSQIYKSLGDDVRSGEYAEKFMETSILLDLGKRQELAATVNNRYLYYRNEMEEQRLIADRQRYQFRMYCAMGGIIILALSGLLLHYYRKHKRMVSLNGLVDSITDTRKATEEKQRVLHEEEELVAIIQESIEHNKEQLSAAKEELRQSLHEAKAKESELAAVERDLYDQKNLVQKKIAELACVRDDLRQTEDELKKNNAILAERIERNKRIHSLRRQATLKGGPIRALATIKDVIGNDDEDKLMDWDEFIEVMDLRYPEFHLQVHDRLGRLKPLQKRTCYLLKAGYVGQEIQHILKKDVSRATAWRWIKIYTTALSDIINN